MVEHKTKTESIRMNLSKTLKPKRSVNWLIITMISAFHFHALAIPNHNNTFTVVDEAGRPIPTVMVTETIATADLLPMDVSDDGYPAPNRTNTVAPTITRFTNTAGSVSFSKRKTSGGFANVSYRFRKIPYQDFTHDQKTTSSSARISLKNETDAKKLAESYPAQAWLGALPISDPLTKKHFQMQCGFCHQQGNSYMRAERSVEDWDKLIKRMVRYGSRLPTDLQKSMPQILSDGYRKLRENPSWIQAPHAWNSKLEDIVITEWVVGDAFSQVHDMLIGANGLVYVADNIQDRLYEVNSKTNEVVVYKIPHRDGEKNGGLISGRLADFPKHSSTSNAHSLALSKKDGHIFITPSAQRRLVEFDPSTKDFKLHEMSGGFYPHTIRIDAHDHVWFTLALSNQIAKFDRSSSQFTLYDLPARNFKEKVITRSIGLLFKIMGWGIPLSNWLKIDWDAIGTPLPYGIDITPDGKVWFARLHTQEIGNLDPNTGAIQMIQTPFLGPRRLRTDAQGNLWIVSFAESKIAKYSPKDAKFTTYDLPVHPIGSETPYSLNVDHKTGIVWVTGNQSDSVFQFNPTTEKWLQIPFSRRTTFTRDVEFSEDGKAYTSNSNFPSWQVEGGQPTLIQIENQSDK